MAVRAISARYAGTCGDCDGAIAVGDPILYGGRGRVAHDNGTCTIDNVEEGPTTRERKAARAERLRGWSAGRAAKSEAGLTSAREMASIIPLGQPILVGHHSEGRDRNYRGRIDRTYERAFADGDKARDMARRADGIDAAAERAIYSDDPDAIEQLETRVTELEAERDRWKAYNTACRKAGASTADALALLDEAQREHVASLARIGWLKPSGAVPTMTNLTTNIARNRKRLAALQREAQ